MKHKPDLFFLSIILIGFIFLSPAKATRERKKYSGVTAASKPVSKITAERKKYRAKSSAASPLVIDSISYPPGCSKLILQNDTFICKGSTVLLNSDNNALKDTAPSGLWRLLIPGSAINQNYFNPKAFSFDKANQYLYSINHKKIFRFDLKNNVVTEIAATNWPGDYSEFTYDYTGNRLLIRRAGRDKVFAVSANGGAWTLIGNGSFDKESYNASSFWNPLTQQPGFYGGYGSSFMKNWIFENNGTGWQQKRADLSDCNPPKGGNLVAANRDGKKLYLFSGQGSCTGNELDSVCTLGSGWGTMNGMFCWLRDLWELDLGTYTFTNILPVNNQSIQYEGAVTYDYDKNTFYLFGGFQPSPDYTANLILPNTDKTFRYRRGTDTGFTAFKGSGDNPPAYVPPSSASNSLNGLAYYDEKDKRIIWARGDGIWALYPDSSAPKPPRAILWSTGDTSASINVSPVQTTKYWVRITNNGTSCSDTITITVDPLKSLLQANTYVCGDTVTTLDAGPGFTSYLWNTGATVQKIPVTANGTYHVKITDSLCSQTDSTRVLFIAAIKDFTAKAMKDSVCPGDKDSLYVVIPQASLTYQWYQVGNANPIGNGTSLVLNNVTQTLDYVVTAQTIPSVCTGKSATVRVTAVQQLATPVIKADTITATSVLFKWNAVPNATGYLISFDNGATFKTPSQGSTALSELVSGLNPNQKVQLMVKAIGTFPCQPGNTAQAGATTLNPIGNLIYVPNSFTPNGDGVNDLFRVYSNALQSIRINIYNQLGERIFFTTDNSKGWDGNQNGVKQPVGVYIYYLEAVMEDGSTQTKKGSFTLLR